MLAPPPGTSAVDQVPLGTPNPNLAAAVIGWQQINAFVNGGMVTGTQDVFSLMLEGDAQFSPNVLL